MRPGLAILLLAAASFGQAGPADAEESHLRRLLVEAGSTPLEFIRAIEKHLDRFPDSTRRPEMERSLARAALDSDDERRILLYGERVLARDENAPELLERVIEILLEKEDRQVAERVLEYAGRYEELVRAMEQEKPRSRRALARWQEEFDRAMARALIFRARAVAGLDRLEEAVSLARRSYDLYPAAESARRIGLCLARMGKEEDALAHLADAFTISDPDNTGADRARDRKRLGELYRKLRGSEAGLGDLVLAAWDRTEALREQRLLLRRELDPNAGLTDPMAFTLSGLRGERLVLASLRGKVLVLDFWATWCAPCRVQHPLYEQVKSRFKDRADVLFLSVNTDEDPAVVEPFLKDNRWSQTVYFEDGLSAALRISSIPTTILIDKRGEVVGRLVGFVPDRFVDTLAERIREALGE